MVSSRAAEESKLLHIQHRQMVQQYQGHRQQVRHNLQHRRRLSQQILTQPQDPMLHQQKIVTIMKQKHHL